MKDAFFCSKIFIVQHANRWGKCYMRIEINKLRRTNEESESFINWFSIQPIFGGASYELSQRIEFQVWKKNVARHDNNNKAWHKDRVMVLISLMNVVELIVQSNRWISIDEAVSPFRFREIEVKWSSTNRMRIIQPAQYVSESRQSTFSVNSNKLNLPWIMNEWMEKI